MARALVDATVGIAFSMLIGLVLILSNNFNNSCLVVDLCFVTRNNH